MTTLNIELFPFQKTLIIAFIGAFIGQIIVVLFLWIKKNIDLSEKKKMIIKDLENQSVILDRMKGKYTELIKLFESKQTDKFTSSVFQDLHLDIFESVPKNELYRIFKKNLFDLVDVYKSIDFLKTHGPIWIYEHYLNKSNLHLKEKENDLNHEFYCSTHLSIIELSKGQIESNLKTIEEIKILIKRIKK
jgi:hypothetical protein